MTANPAHSEFARRLHEKMRGEKLRVWFAPEDMQGDQKLIEQIDRAIQVNDRLLRSVENEKTFGDSLS